MVTVYDIVVHPFERILVAGTHARSMYKLDLSTYTGVEGPREQLPERFTLAQNYPNPFNPSTSIAFTLTERSEIALQIYNVSGQLVRTLVQESRPAGEHEVRWDGRNSAGQEVASGKYWYRLRSETQTLQKQMTLLR